MPALFEQPEGAIGEILSQRTQTSKTWHMGTLPDGREQRRIVAGIGPAHVPTDYQAYRQGLAFGWEDPDIRWVRNRADNGYVMARAFYGCEVLDGTIGYRIFDKSTGHDCTVVLDELDGVPLASVPVPTLVGDRIVWDFGNGMTIYLRPDLHRMDCFKRLEGAAARATSFTWRVDKHNFLEDSGFTVNLETAGIDNAERAQRTVVDPNGRTNGRRALKLRHVIRETSDLPGNILRNVVEEIWDGDTYVVNPQTRERTPVRGHDGVILIDQDVSADVASDEDDGHVDGTTFRCIYNSDDHVSDSGANFRPRYRWSGITVPQGATVDSAVITLTMDGGGSGPHNGVFALHDADSIATLTSSGCDSTVTTLTPTSTVAVNAMPTSGTVNITVTSQLQTVVNRAGWAEDTLAGFFTTVVSSGYRYIRDRNGGPSNGAATIAIDYTTSGDTLGITPLEVEVAPVAPTLVSDVVAAPAPLTADVTLAAPDLVNDVLVAPAPTAADVTLVSPTLVSDIAALITPAAIDVTLVAPALAADDVAAVAPAVAAVTIVAPTLADATLGDIPATAVAVTLVAPALAADDALDIDPLTPAVTLVAPTLVSDAVTAIAPLAVDVTLVPPDLVSDVLVAPTPLAVGVTLVPPDLVSNVVVAPGPVAAAVTLVPPVLDADDAAAVTPLVAAVTLVAPTLVADDLVAPPPIADSVTVIAPTLVAGDVLDIDPAAVEVTLVAPGIAAEGGSTLAITPITAEVTIVPPVLVADDVAAITPAAIAVTLVPPTLVTGDSLVPDPETVPVTLVAPGLVSDVVVPAGPAANAVTLVAPTLVNDIAAAVPPQTVAVTIVTPTLTSDDVALVAAVPAEVTIVAPSILVEDAVVPDPLIAAVTIVAPDLLNDVFVAPSPIAIVVTFVAPTLSAGDVIAPVPLPAAVGVVSPTLVDGTAVAVPPIGVSVILVTPGATDDTDSTIDSEPVPAAASIVPPSLVNDIAVRLPVLGSRLSIMPPLMIDPEDRIPHVSNLCSLGPRPLTMTGFMRLILTEHFRSAANIEHVPFRERLWKAGDSTGILVEDATVWTPSRTNLRPAVVIKQNRWTSLKRGINNWHGTTPEGFDEHVKFMRGSHTLYCTAKEGAEAEILAAETYRYLLHYSPVFREYFDLMMFELADVGALTELEEAAETYAVPVTVIYGWSESWIMRLHTPKLKRLALSSLFPPKC